LFFALLVAYPWEVLTLGTLLYLAFLPIGFMSYRKYQRRDAEHAAARPNMHAVTENDAPSLSPGHSHGPPRSDRPARLN
jgi:CDP-diacylglycerol--serine O-phosphatidyltransferase